MTMKSVALMGCAVWVVIGTILTVDNQTNPVDVHVPTSFFSYADRTPLTP